jgi:predicted metal-dependent TIM-barrel fold hydrolase
LPKKGASRFNVSMRFATVDAHLHAEGLTDADLETLARFGVHQVVLCAHDGALPVGDCSAASWRGQFDRLLGFHGPRLERAGLRPMFVLGVHPAHAPERGLEALLEDLPAYLSHPAVVGVGTLGLERFDAHERHVLDRQLALAAELRRPVWMEPSALQGNSGLRRLAGVLHASGFPLERALIGRVTPAMLPTLLALGFTLALEPSEGRLSLADLTRVLKRHGASRFVLSSHAGEGSADLLAVPALVSHLFDAGLPRDLIRRVARDNALAFIGRPDAMSPPGPTIG